MNNQFIFKNIIISLFNNTYINKFDNKYLNSKLTLDIKIIIY